MNSLMRRLDRLFRAGPAEGRPRPWRPLLESLEDRCLLASGYHLSPLISDIPGLAPVTDSNLVNPWGISESATSPFWVSDNGGNSSTLYNTQGAKVPLVVSIPTPGSATTSTGTPTGTVFNIAQGSGAFKVSGVDKNNNPISAAAIFLFATEDGTIVGWNPNVNPTGFDPAKAGTYGIIAVDNSQVPSAGHGAVYKGLAIGTDANGVTRLYAANFRSGKVDVFDTSFHAATLTAGAFTDAGIPNGFAPFDVQVLGTKVYVNYAKQDAAMHDDVAGPGNGYVDVYNLDGTGLQRLVSGGTGSPLNSPWALAIAPGNFGDLSNDLLVGNFGDGAVNAFDPTTGASKGVLKDASGNPITIDGLWALKFGNGAAGGNTNTLYYTAGSLGEQHGVFGMIQAISDQPLTALGTTVAAPVGTAFTGLVASFTDADPAAKPADFTATINWGDGHTSAGTIAAGANGGFTVSGTNTFAKKGTFAISVVITDTNTTNDPGGSTATASSTATAAPPLPTLTTPDQRFLDLVFQDLLQRPIDPTGLAFWTSQLTAGVSRTQVVQGITNSEEYRIVVVSNLYNQLLHRVPDAGGLASFVSFLGSGGTVEQAAASIAGSPEYLATRGGGTPSGFVSALFQDVLNRPPDPTGLAAFTGLLASGGTNSQVAAAIFSSGEYQQNLVQSYYQRFLHRAADPGGLASFTGALQQGVSDAAIIAAIMSSGEFAGLV
jgi:uncharacterized protein (TIGR03118 family)